MANYRLINSLDKQCSTALRRIVFVKQPFLVSFLLLLILTACGSVKSNFIPVPDPTHQPTQNTANESQSIDIGDGGIISGKPCASPCFFGIHVGETLLDQVVPLLEAVGVSPCVRNGINIFCSSNSNTTNIIVVANKLTLVVVGISYNPSVPILVGDMVSKYGNPSSVNLELDNTGTPESPKLLMSISWDSINIGANLAEVPAKGDQAYSVESTTEVQWITLGADEYFVPSQPWKGYGSYTP